MTRAVDFLEINLRLEVQCIIQLKTVNLFALHTFKYVGKQKNNLLRKIFGLHR